VKENDDDDSMMDVQIDNEGYYMNKRCYCCKQLGHIGENCPKDPNIKTYVDADKDFSRI
jgi:hypothetical protein